MADILSQCDDCNLTKIAAAELRSEGRADDVYEVLSNVKQNSGRNPKGFRLI